MQETGVEHMRDRFDQLRQMDFNDIDGWPRPLRAAAIAAAFCVTLLAGHVVHVSSKHDALNARIGSETELKHEYERKALPAAGIEALRARHAHTAAEFEALLRQLPKDTEVPGLIEDISRAAIANGLTTESIDLEPERATGFYMELPISIAVRGSYHDIGAFVSDVAALPRIVTLHDFEIAPEAPSGQAVTAASSQCDGDCYNTDVSALRMAILAKTYSYLARPAAGDLARISHQPPAARADASVLRGRAPSSRFDVPSSTPASTSGPRGHAGRRLDALATNVGEICGLEART